MTNQTSTEPTNQTSTITWRGFAATMTREFDEHWSVRCECGASFETRFPSEAAAVGTFQEHVDLVHIVSN